MPHRYCRIGYATARVQSRSSAVRTRKNPTISLSFLLYRRAAAACSAALPFSARVPPPSTPRRRTAALASSAATDRGGQDGRQGGQSGRGSQGGRRSCKPLLPSPWPYRASWVDSGDVPRFFFLLRRFRSFLGFLVRFPWPEVGFRRRLGD